jgi:hypothetical protein
LFMTKRFDVLDPCYDMIRDLKADVTMFCRLFSPDYCKEG